MSAAYVLLEDHMVSFAGHIGTVLAGATLFAVETLVAH